MIHGFGNKLGGEFRKMKKERKKNIKIVTILREGE